MNRRDRRRQSKQRHGTLVTGTALLPRAQYTDAEAAELRGKSCEITTDTGTFPATITAVMAAISDDGDPVWALELVAHHVPDEVAPW